MQIRTLDFLVLDEADRMIEAGHFEELDNIVKLTLRPGQKLVVSVLSPLLMLADHRRPQK